MATSHGLGARHSRSVALRDFLDQVSANFCPYIEPACEHDVLSFSEYTTDELTATGRGDIRAGLLYTGIVITERLRRRRAMLRRDGHVAASQMICDNIVVLGTDNAPGQSAKNVVDWPHYLLKSIYSETALMFGKFWTNEEGLSRDERAIPIVPITFLSIRAAIRPRDPKLLRRQTVFAAMIQEASDVGQDVLHERVGIPGATATVDGLADNDTYRILKAATTPRR